MFLRVCNKVKIHNGSYLDTLSTIQTQIEMNELDDEVIV